MRVRFDVAKKSDSHAARKKKKKKKKKADVAKKRNSLTWHNKTAGIFGVFFHSHTFLRF